MGNSSTSTSWSDSLPAAAGASTGQTEEAGGETLIVNKASGYAVENYRGMNGERYPGSVRSQVPKEKDPNMRWKVRHVEDNIFSFENAGSGLLLTSRLRDEDNVIACPHHRGARDVQYHRWRIVQKPDNYFFLKNVATTFGLCNYFSQLGMLGSVRAERGEGNRPDQQWKFDDNVADWIRSKLTK